MEGRIVSILSTASGLTIIGGVITCLGGIGLCGWAGISKESELTEEEKQADGRRVRVGKGVRRGGDGRYPQRVLCVRPRLRASRLPRRRSRAGPTPLFSNNASLVVILIGGFVEQCGLVPVPQLP